MIFLRFRTPIIASVFLGVLVHADVCLAQKDDYRPIDPMASIGGEAILLGELHLLLRDQLGIRDPDNAKPEVKQAAALMLVRRRLALRSMQAQGGELLTGLIETQTEKYVKALKQRGSSMKAHAKSRNADERSLRASLAWQIAWGQFLKSKLNENTLRSYFAREMETYAGGRWDVSQIFLAIDSKNPNSAGIANDRMESITSDLKSASSLPEAFAAAAKEHSESGSSDSGGRVGWVEGTADLPRTVMNLVRTTKPGQLAGPVKSPLGLHLVLVHQHEVKKMKFEDMTNQAQLRRDATNALFDLMVKKQKGVKINWFIKSLAPPAGTAVIP